jgi:hypothetical protein
MQWTRPRVRRRQFIMAHGWSTHRDRARVLAIARALELRGWSLWLQLDEGVESTADCVVPLCLTDTSSHDNKLFLHARDDDDFARPEAVARRIDSFLRAQGRRPKRRTRYSPRVCRV